MTILSGDQGGIIFRAISGSVSFYYLHINRKGQYTLEKFSGLNSLGTITQGRSPAIKTGLGQSNLLVVVANGNTFSLYGNLQLVATVNDSIGSVHSHGQVRVNPENTDIATDIVFSNAHV